MRSFITSATCITAMFATGFTAAQQNGVATIQAQPSPSQQAAPVPPVAPAAPRFNFSRSNQTDPFNNDLFLARPAGFPATFTRSKAERGVQSKISKATRMLKSEDADKRSEAEDQLKDAVSELFDIRTKSRREQIESLEKRLADLRKQLEKREDKKSDIVRLHVQTLVNQANGLGF